MAAFEVSRCATLVRGAARSTWPHCPPRPWRTGRAPVVATAALAAGCTNAWRRGWRWAGSGARIVRRAGNTKPGEPAGEDGALDGVSRALRGALRRFEAEVQKDDRDIDLTRAAALMALHAEPELDLDASVFSPLAQLREGFRVRADELERVAGRGLTEAGRLEGLAASLCSYMSAQGFVGCGRSQGEFYCADNSLLHRVLERRRGIPISLAVVYREVGLAAGLDLWGANFPGYFFLGYGRGEAAGLVDAFSGRMASSAQASEVLSEVFGQSVRLDPGWASGPPLPNTVFLRRMVRNLQNVYERDGNLSQGARIMQYAQVLDSLAIR
mmetsp:Transcript_55194/g.170950  ORF Transcript_55194/g.170950 Transcript_55194/m.170950 type:complete len:327 (-) Transcript_55194:136-1116(-)